jgi:REP element-mobilizing transposase RayT
MPNHIHVLLEPRADLATIVQGWKSFTSRWVLRQNQRLGLGIPASDQLWMREYWDRYIRDAEHYQKAVEYIEQNPVKAGLCRRPEDWSWSSGNADVPVGPSLLNCADGDVGAPGSLS